LARFRYVFFVVLGTVLAGAVGFGLMHRPAPIALNVLPPAPTALPTAQPTPGRLRVHVEGPVKAPGVYELPPGALVQEALQAAGGATTDADLQRLNLAAEVQDQQQIIVPRRSVVATPDSLPVRAQQIDIGVQVNINTADSETLQTLPGIGPVIAARIIEYRNAHGDFVDVEQLIEVKGIGEKIMDNLRSLITIGP
jgi:competence protein ComEA